MKIFLILTAFVAYFALTYAQSISGGEGILYPVIPGLPCKTVGDPGQNLLNPAQTCYCTNVTILLILKLKQWGNCSNTPPPIRTPITNLAYGNDSAQVLDFYPPPTPPSTENGTKVIVLIHGGAWGGGKKSEMQGFVDYLSKDFPNHYIANLEYRLGTNDSPGFPKQLDDIGLALTFLQSYLSNDTVTFALMGGSAGAHLSMLYAYSRDSVTNKTVKAVVSLVGPGDLTDPNYTKNFLYNSLFFALVGPCTYEQCPDKYNTTSPVIYISDQSAPTIGFYGDRDILVPSTQMPIIRSKLNEFGVTNNFTVYRGGHGDWAYTDQMNMMGQIKTFFTVNWV